MALLSSTLQPASNGSSLNFRHQMNFGDGSSACSKDQLLDLVYRGDASGRSVARRNLWLSIPALTIAFAVWMLWSVVVVTLPAAGFRFSTNQLFWLAALPALCGATLRIFYAFAVPSVGGRRWTAISTASLLLPALGIGFAVRNPATSYEAFVALALLCGLGGGNFASSMAHVGFLYPSTTKNRALGLNAGLGHLGIPIAQLVVPLVITAGVLGPLAGAPQAAAGGTPMWLQNAGFIWVPFIAASALAAWIGMHDLAEAKTSFADQAVIFTRKHNWLLSLLCLGTLGSFIGHAAGFPLLMQSQFPDIGALHYAWLGPLVGLLAWPLGGGLSARFGSARVTLWSFVAMALGMLAVLQCLPGAEGDTTAGADGHFTGFLAGSLWSFAAAGAGIGSSLRMIPAVFLSERRRSAAKAHEAQEQAATDAGKEAGAVLGFASAIGAYGGFFIPKSYGSSIAMTGGPAVALYAFVAFYLVCIAITWWTYSRRYAPTPC